MHRLEAENERLKERIESLYAKESSGDEQNRNRRIRFLDDI